MKLKNLSILLGVALLAGCATTDVTKTGKGHYDPTNPNNVEILMTKPAREFIELGAVSAAKFKPKQTATMHNAFRAKASALGADAVYIINSGIDQDGHLWATGVAVRYSK
ncbi:MAG: hypothetical protein U1F65_05905 [Verrucomicrobiota bacterium]